LAGSVPARAKWCARAGTSTGLRRSITAAAWRRLCHQLRAERAVEGFQQGALLDAGDFVEHADIGLGADHRRL
jgi:hypothetical protein